MCIFNMHSGDSDAHELEPTLWEILFQKIQLVDDPICQQLINIWNLASLRAESGLAGMRSAGRRAEQTYHCHGYPMLLFISTP